MHGFDSDGIRFAHADSWAGAGSTHIIDRIEREAREHVSLAPLATRSFGAGNRAIAEEADPSRDEMKQSKSDTEIATKVQEHC